MKFRKKIENTSIVLEKQAAIELSPTTSISVAETAKKKGSSSESIEQETHKDVRMKLSESFRAPSLMIIRISILFNLLALPFMSFADTFDECVVGSMQHHHISACARQSNSEQLSRFNAASLEIESVLSSAEVESFEKAQNLWMDYKSDYCNYIYHTVFPGREASIEKLACESSLMKEREHIIRALYSKNEYPCTQYLNKNSSLPTKMKSILMSDQKKENQADDFLEKSAISWNHYKKYQCNVVNNDSCNQMLLYSFYNVHAECLVTKTVGEEIKGLYEAVDTDSLIAMANLEKKEVTSLEYANNLAYYLQKLGEHQHARELLEKVISTDPSRTVAYFNLADSLDALGEKDKAVTNYEIYVEQMAKNGKAAKIPQRVTDYIKIHSTSQ